MVAISSHVDDEITEQCRQVGFDLVLSAPLNVDSARLILDKYNYGLKNMTWQEKEETKQKLKSVE